MLHAEQHSDVVAHAAQAFFSPGKDLADQAVMDIVFPGPLGDGDALVVQPRAGFSGCS